MGLRPVIAAAVVGACVLALASGHVAGQQEKEAQRIVGLRYHEPKETQFLKAVLTALNLRYTVTATTEGELVEWLSTDPAQVQEIQNRVSQFWFISTQCPGMSLPSPSQPARATLSC